MLGLIVQTVSGQPYERYIRSTSSILWRCATPSPRRPRRSGKVLPPATILVRPARRRRADNRGLLPAGYLISSAEDMAHYLIAQLNQGNYGGSAVLSPAGDGRTAPTGRPNPDRTRPTAWAGLSVQSTDSRRSFIRAKR